MDLPGALQRLSAECTLKVYRAVQEELALFETVLLQWSSQGRYVEIRGNAQEDILLLHFDLGTYIRNSETPSVCGPATEV